MVAPVRHWTCEPCEGRPRQRPGEKKDWSVELQAIDDQQEKQEKRLKTAGVAAAVVACFSCTVL